MYSVILGYTHVGKNVYDGKSQMNRQINKEGCILDAQFVHHPEMYKVTKLMSAKSFLAKWANEGNGIFGKLAFGELAFEETTFGEPTFGEK